MGYPFPLERPYQWQISAGKHSTVKELKDDFWPRRIDKKINKSKKSVIKDARPRARRASDLRLPLRATSRGKKTAERKGRKRRQCYRKQIRFNDKKAYRNCAIVDFFFSLYVWSQILGQWYFVLVLLICCFYFSSPSPPTSKTQTQLTEHKHSPNNFNQESNIMSF